MEHHEEGAPGPVQEWTLAEYELLRAAVQAALASMTPITLATGDFYAGVAGPLWWDILAAMERDPNPRPGPGRPRK